MIFFFNDTATTEIYTLSLHDALPISRRKGAILSTAAPATTIQRATGWPICFWAKSTHIRRGPSTRSEEHTSELQSQSNLVCRLLLEKKKKQIKLQLNVNESKTNMKSK